MLACVLAFASSGSAAGALLVNVDGPSSAGVGQPVEYWAGVVSTAPHGLYDPLPTYTYAWSVDGVAISRSADALQPSMLALNFPAAGAHTIGVTVTDPVAGETGAASASVTIMPPAPVKVAPPDIVFAGGQVPLGRRGVPVVLRCTVLGGCRGTLEVRTFALSGDGRRLGAAHFAVQGTGTVRVPVSARNRRILRRHRTTPVILRAVRDGHTETWAQGAVDVAR